MATLDHPENGKVEQASSSLLMVPVRKWENVKVGERLRRREARGSGLD